MTTIASIRVTESILEAEAIGRDAGRECSFSRRGWRRRAERTREQALRGADGAWGWMRDADADAGRAHEDAAAGRCSGMLMLLMGHRSVRHRGEPSAVSARNPRLMQVHHQLSVRAHAAGVSATPASSCEPITCCSEVTDDTPIFPQYQWERKVDEGRGDEFHAHQRTSAHHRRNFSSSA
ncbi:hypothetical protein E1301_Tti021166 [Triplophysa tibetana]|uniref:Uncharacterized protein n=1 Tax=Triplophysa tibetana TaxID=1572043 RepID=A0A5A9P093_9TELE|nr:hypothetical protein E1301_Tti021166 [Triplophysa tibetana]